MINGRWWSKYYSQSNDLFAHILVTFLSLCVLSVDKYSILWPSQYIDHLIMTTIYLPISIFPLYFDWVIKVHFNGKTNVFVLKGDRNIKVLLYIGYCWKTVHICYVHQRIYVICCLCACIWTGFKFIKYKIVGPEVLVLATKL